MAIPPQLLNIVKERKYIVDDDGPLDENYKRHIYPALHKPSSTQVIVKFIPPTRKTMYEREVRVLSFLSTPPSPAIVHMVDHYWFDDKIGGVVITKRVPDSCDLFDYINSLKTPMVEHRCMYIFEQIVDTLLKLEQLCISHGDLKDENVMINTNDDTITVLDFGSAFFPIQTASETINRDSDGNMPFEGTPAYAPPEWHREGWFTLHGLTAWQLGHILYHLLTGRSVPKGQKERDECLSQQNIHERAVSIVLQCLCNKPTLRPHLRSIKTMIRHYNSLQYTTDGVKNNEQQHNSTDDTSDGCALV